ncbi:hypothetical protein J3459_002496 [Metarhizium acridum]|nr:hypothetical protein J3459_002496 [Metarhizium acridum]
MSRFCEEHTYLREAGFHWEAQRIQSIVFPVIDFEETKKTFMKKPSFGPAANNIKAEEVDESMLLSELIISNGFEVVKLLVKKGAEV